MICATCCGEDLDLSALLYRALNSPAPDPYGHYLLRFVRDEILLRRAEAGEWQSSLCRLLNYELQHGMPVKLSDDVTFRIGERQSRNAEEALLGALNACARTTGEISKPTWPDHASAGELILRLRGQRLRWRMTIPGLDCLSLMDFSGQGLVAQDLVGADLSSTALKSAALRGANLSGADLRDADLRGANLSGADLRDATLGGAKLEQAMIYGTALKSAALRGANLTGADLPRRGSLARRPPRRGPSGREPQRRRPPRRGPPGREA